MGVRNDKDDVVLIEKGKTEGEPWVITVNCPDKSGLGVDICRTILEFGLYISKGDVSTDGKWCYIVLWVVPHSSTRTVLWVFSELELTIERVKVTTTPDGRVMDLFFITDNLILLHTKQRQEETYEQLRSVLGESCIVCELQLADSHYETRQGTSYIAPAVAEELFASEYSKNVCHTQTLSPELTKLKKAVVNVDNSLSPSHTLLQIHGLDHKGLFYDIMRTVNDQDVKILHGRFSAVAKGHRDIDLFIQQKDGKKILDPEKESLMCSSLKTEMLHPLRVLIANRGPDTELLVANPVELSGRGRPRVFYDCTVALKKLGICVFSAEIGRFSASDREWEVYRFLLDENCEYQLLKPEARNQIVDRVRRILMGW
ncbi:hypothetical protein KSS87_009767 [Heliosperma pusillum]|nr:hypothetical protein KSS87_009767 [Heliosperma pusillum]